MGVGSTWGILRHLWESRIVLAPSLIPAFEVKRLGTRILFMVVARALGYSSKCEAIAEMFIIGETVDRTCAVISNNKDMGIALGGVPNSMV